MSWGKGKRLPRSGSAEDKRLLEELEAAATAGDISALNTLGVCAERDGDHIKAAALHSLALDIWTEWMPDEFNFDRERKNKAILEANSLRALELLLDTEHEEWAEVVESVSAQYKSDATPVGFSEVFLSGLAYVYEKPRFILQRLHAYAPFLSLIICVGLLQFMDVLADVSPTDSIMKNEFHGELSGMLVIFFFMFAVAGQVPIRGRFVYAKIVGWIVFIFSLEFLTAGLAASILGV